MKVDYIVEADDDTVYLLFLLMKDYVKWDSNIQEFHNRGVFLGKDSDFPNMVSLAYCGIDDKVVCFYWGTGQLVNWKEIDEYMKKEYPDVENIGSNSLVHKFREF